MGISIMSTIFLSALMLFIGYAIIETAVRKGIDSSKTSLMIEEYIKKQMEEKEEQGG